MCYIYQCACARPDAPNKIALAGASKLNGKIRKDWNRQWRYSGQSNFFMAQRRMFSPAIVGSDAFLDMPTSSRELYFQLGMAADDDGFVNPKRIMRMVGASEDDLKVLLTKRFCLTFESGVIVIKHWKINNLIKLDRYKETMYVEEKRALKTKENGIYTEIRQPNGSRMEPQVRLG